MITALTKAPAPTLTDCELTYLTRDPLDFALAQQQHRAYCAALHRHGAQVITLPADDRLPDSVFVEDTAIVFDELAVLTPMGSDARRKEPDAIAPELARWRAVQRITHPARIEGGDVLTIGRRVYVGLSPRTNAAGVDALRRIIGPYGYVVIPVAVTGCLHLKTGCTALDPETVLINTAWVDPALFAGYELVAVPQEEPWAANVLRLGDILLMHSAFPRTIDVVTARGLRANPLDISEFSKAEAGLTCLSLIFAMNG
jgi:dimethylargininase